MQWTRHVLRAPLALALAALMAFSTLSLATAGQWLSGHTYSGCETTVFAGATSSQSSAWDEDINNCASTVRARVFRYYGGGTEQSTQAMDPYFAYRVLGGTTVYAYGQYSQDASGTLTSPNVYP